MKKHLRTCQVGVLLLLIAHAEAFGKQNDAAALPDSGADEPTTTIVNEKNAASSADQQNAEKLKTDGRVFGYRNGYLHAALALNEEWTDNLYNYDRDKQDNLLTRVTPSAWFSWPRRYRRPIQIAPDNTVPGGLQYSLSDYEVFNKYQVYLAGKMDLMNYSADSDLNHAESGLEALLQYQPKARLNLNLLDKYTHSQDIFNVAEATSENDRKYNSNIFGLGLDWHFSDRFSLKAGFNNFTLAYEEDINNYLDRVDNGLDCALYYEYSPKTNFFAGYNYLFAAYDENVLPDNSNIYLNAGVNWKATVKTSYMFKAGYQNVNYDDAPASAAHRVDNSAGGFNFEVQGTWQVTQKSNLLLNSKYGIEQTDTWQALNKTVFAGRIGLDHRFTGRLRGEINFIYENSDYDMFNGKSRVDDRWYLKPELQFALNKWLFFNVYYSYDTKDSNYDELDYGTNVLGIGVRGSF